LGQLAPVSLPSFLTITDQVAEHLRAEILRGRWSGMLPGKHELAAELGLNNKTIEAALWQLEKDGLLIPQGTGRRRRINPKGGKSSRALRVAILALDLKADRKLDYMVDLHHSLSEAGHTVHYAARSLTDIRFDLKPLGRLVEETKTDAWLVLAGSREVLQWFAGRPEPAFALFGQREGLRIAGFGPNKAPACADATRRLIELGHRRIVLLCRRIRRFPSPGLSERAFLDELSTAGIRTGDYNLPDWEEYNGGFQKCLNALFRVTPPTALIVDEAPWFVAALQCLAGHGIRVPYDVSLICTDNDAAFAGCAPPIACITWDTRPLVRRVVNWASNISRGKTDLRQTTTPATFIPGGSIARPRQGD
jgi:DNA-binding transcriptional regulator YhcF (GntR family)